MTRPVILKPRLSEKAYGLSEERNTYVFDVAANVNKFEVGQAVKAQYSVAPKDVRIAKIRGKSQRSVRQKGRSIKRFSRRDITKAYVTLNKGDHLPIFSAIEESKSKKPATKEAK